MRCTHNLQMLPGSSHSLGSQGDLSPTQHSQRGVESTVKKKNIEKKYLPRNYRIILLETFSLNLSRETNTETNNLLLSKE